VRNSLKTPSTKIGGYFNLLASKVIEILTSKYSMEDHSDLQKTIWTKGSKLWFSDEQPYDIDGKMKILWLELLKFPAISPFVFVDLGCGSGKLIANLAKFKSGNGKYVGLDMNLRFIHSDYHTLISQGTNLSFIQSDLRGLKNIEFSDETKTLIFTMFKFAKSLTPFELKELLNYLNDLSKNFEVFIAVQDVTLNNSSQQDKTLYFKEMRPGGMYWNHNWDNLTAQYGLVSIFKKDYISGSSLQINRILKYNSTIVV
jgi:SAM-dependent methyltransferase